MLNKARHQLVMKQILEGIYQDVSLAPLLGFKGGTAAAMFYGLNRFSADLDFDLLDGGAHETPWEMIRDKIKTIMQDLGQIKKAAIKRNTIFFLLSYGQADHNIKVEISQRKPAWLSQDYFELKDHLGLPIQVAKPHYLFASKLVALATRKVFANRDLFDVHYFCKSRWEIDEVLIRAMTGKTVKEFLPDCIQVVEKVNKREILAGLGELLNDEKQKAWVKTHLKEQTIFLLKSYLSVLK